MDRDKKNFFYGERVARDRPLFQPDDFHREEPDNNYYVNAQELTGKLDDANKKFEELKETLNTLEKKTQEKFEKEVGVLKQQIDESKNKVVETLALFAALFTFLSLQVQVFKDQTDEDHVIGLILITGGLITFFVLILDIMIKSKKDSDANFLKLRFFLLMIMSVLLIIAGVSIMKLQP